MKKDKIFKFLLLLLSVVLVAAPAQAQKKKKANRVTVSGVVVNEAGDPLKNVAITAGEGALTIYSAEDGSYTLETKTTSPIVYEIEGYETKIIYLATDGIPTEVVMPKADLRASMRDVITRGDGETLYNRDYVGAMGKADVDKIRMYPDLSLSNALQGRIAGLVSREGNGGLGSNTSSLSVRGQHTTGNNAAMVIVDGIERDSNDLVAEEIEAVEVLKDATAKMLYGPTAINGVVLITTKRGIEGRKEIRATAEYGVMQATRLPEFLGAYEYANLYNEAAMNDGLMPRYTPAQLEGYKNSTGAHDALYPNVDWYDTFLNKIGTFTKASVEFLGGNKNVKYALVAAYMDGRGLEKIGPRTMNNQINIRGNLDVKISPSVTFKADIAGRLRTSSWAMRNQSAIMSALSTNKPNEYALTIDKSFFGGVEQTDGVPYFGGSLRVNNNLYADLLYSGNNKKLDTFSQMNVGLDVNLDKLVKGLSAEAYFTFDNYDSLTERLESTYPTYALRQSVGIDGTPNMEAIALKKISISTDKAINGSDIGRLMGLRANVAYKRDFGKHSFSAVASARYFKQEFKGASQDRKNLNVALRLNYDFANKYFVEAALGCMGSNAYYGAEQYMLSPTGGIAWVASNEDFLKDVSWLDYLKVKASAGMIGTDLSATPVLYPHSWVDNGSWNFGSGNGTSNPVVSASVLQNPDLKWEKQIEANVGVEAVMLSNRLSFEANYFREKRVDIISRNAELSSALGDFYWFSNVADVSNQGVDAYLRWSDRVGSDFSYAVGVNFLYSKNKIEKIDEGNVTDDRSKIGKPTSANITYKYAGMFGKDVDIASHPFQPFGAVQAGDLAYVDTNLDKVIDGRDQVMIGQSYPLTVWGIDVNLNYKGFGLYILGTAETGVQKLANNAFFQNYGENSYSVLARDAYHPVRNPNGSQPRLSTMSGNGNNWRASEFWYRDCSFFRLKNVELSYTFKNTRANRVFSYLKVFVRGTNLFVLSPMKDLDPERLNAGLENYPMLRTVTGGVSFTF